MAFEIGQRVGDYEILELLGRGGMGHVYRARNIISDRIEAMKVLLPDLSAERDLAVRFISEIRTLATFDHPNIALLHTAFQSDNQLIMIMEYVEGYTLEQRAKQSPMSVAEITGYVSQALSALSYAHERGVIHRDIKPANLMVTTHGVVKLMDFGIAKSNVDINLTRPGTTIGSFYYMSPEQVRGSNVDARSDLYSIGIVLYELLAGRRPFESDSTYGVLNQQLNDAPQPPIEINPSLPPQLNAIILTALSKDPADRFQNAEAFRNALKAFRTESPGVEANAAGPVPVSAPAGAASFKDVPASKQAASSQPPPQMSAKNNKPLWIATGALAAMLALVALAIGVPHLLKTHAASEAANTASSNQPAATPAPAADQSTAATAPPAQPDNSSTPATPLATTPPDPSTPANTPASTGAVQPAQTTSTPASAGTVNRHSAQLPSAHKGVAAAQSDFTQPYKEQEAQAAVQPPPGPSEADLDQLRERMVQLGARADAVNNSISQLRSQQQAQGLDLRNDMVAADSRLNAYIRAANQDARASRVASAQKNMDKANAELSILEKFLGQ